MDASVHPDVSRRFRDAASRVVASGLAGDEAVAALAKRQQGVFTGEQAEICGLGRRAREGRVRRAQWQRIHREVFLLGIEPPSYPAAVLAATVRWSPGVAAGGLSAAWFHRMLERQPSEVHVTALDGRNRGRLRGARLSVPKVHVPSRVLWHHGIPILDPVDTLFELAALLDPETLEVACARALRSHVISRAQLDEPVHESRPRPGLRALRAAAAAPTLTRSKYERMLRRLVTRAELHHGAEFNVLVHGKELDVYWPAARFGVEIDAFSTHGDAASFEDDRKLDADFGAGGIEVRRFTGRRLEHHPHAVAARIAALLTQRLGGLPLPERR